MIKTCGFKIGLAIILAFSGCRKTEQEKIISRAEPYQPSNLFPRERLPSYFNRVVVMPAYCDASSVGVLQFADDLLHQELSKSRIFEPVKLTPKACLELFGKERISSIESLPDNFLNVLTDTYAANGVLFIDLHSYSPYRPISIGVRAKLVDLKSGEFMWAIDETVDGGDASVAVAVLGFQKTKHVQALSENTSGSILQSPRMFMKFLADSIFSTLPNR